ncbi:ABC transporter permease [Oribacterium sp. HCP28S3_H8]|uniref:ABC transporter permease n=1 Tax=Oribacterium sp. HCP28S3_H8 TaxID=3438945 RepID=UPI003F89EF15
MAKYIVKRLITAIPIFFGITIIIYTMLNLAPGSALDMLASSEMSVSSEAYQQLKAQLGLDQPLWVRYLLWLKDLVHFNFGTSYRTSQSVALMVSQRIVPSVILSGTGVIIAILLSLPIGIMAAYKPYSKWDNISSFFALIGSTLPGFLLSLLLIYFFSIKLKLLPTQGMHSSGNTSLPDLIRHLILPALIIAIGSMGNLIKQTRSACLEMLGEDFVKTARSKGISEMAVMVFHVFRTALIPISTTILLQIPHIIGGTTIVEQIFSWPGLGSLMISSINNRDYPVVMCIATLIAVTVLVTNILIDIIHGLLDPRISYS